MTPADNNPSAKVTLEMKIPLWGAMTVLGSGVVALIGLYFQMQMMTASVVEVQATLKNNNTAVSGLLAEQSLIKYRLNAVESDVARLNDLVRKDGPVK